MENDVTEKISRLFSRAVTWAEKQSSEILKNGRSLTTEEVEMAIRAGVVNPDRVRIAEVVAIPVPENKELSEVALALGLLSPTMVGLTFGYGIYIVKGHELRFIPHELRHVQQFEKLGSISNFLTVYLEQPSKFGYKDAPLEIEAREFEPV
jgi:hypothetical protein